MRICIRRAVLTIFLTLGFAAHHSEAAAPGGGQSSATREEPGLTLERAVARALEMSPSLAAKSHAVSAAGARVVQAGLIPNPELELEVENVGGGGNFDGFDAAESTVVISQPILLGGKRSRGRALAESEHALSQRDLDAQRLDVIAATTQAFYRVLAAQEREVLASELLELARRSMETVQARVDAGKVSPVDATRVGIEVAQARVGLTRAERELKTARSQLAASWGASSQPPERVVGELPAPVDQPDREWFRERLAEAPEVARLELLIERQQRVVDLERAVRLPDLVVSVGPRRFEENGQTAWVAGLALPIPLFDRNQGARKAAGFELESQRRGAEAARVNLEAELTAMLERLHAAAAEAALLGGEVVPAAHSAFIATETGYREGKFGLLDVLDAQRSLFEVRSLELDSRAEYALTLTGIERLIGGRVSTTAPSRAAAGDHGGDN